MRQVGVNCVDEASPRLYWLALSELIETSTPNRQPHVEACLATIQLLVRSIMIQNFPTYRFFNDMHPRRNCMASSVSLTHLSFVVHKGNGEKCNNKDNQIRSSRCRGFGSPFCIFLHSFQSFFIDLVTSDQMLLKLIASIF